MKKILIELPTWLGDTVMTTPAIEKIVHYYPQVELTMIGSMVSTEIFKHHPNVKKIIVMPRKTLMKRLIWIYKTQKNLGKFDVAITFRRPLLSKLLIKYINAHHKAYYTRYTKTLQHQVEHYNDFINKKFSFTGKATKLKIYYTADKPKKKILGLNPGASYGSAKRWYPEKFAHVAKVLSEKYESIIIFGGEGEIKIANDIENILKKDGISCHNLAGKTTIEELCLNIATLRMFITGDSGPMHIAAAYAIPTVALFGPTDYQETSQWGNPYGNIISKNLSCAPCMKRVCPLQHHECMKTIEADNVIVEVANLEKKLQ